MIFVDLDGVLADFDASLLKLFGNAPRGIETTARDIENEIGSVAFWDKIREADDFYRTLPKMADADVLWEGVLKYDPHPTILTGIPSSMPHVPWQKRDWCEQYFPGIEVITCFSKDKALACQKCDILIDDWAKYRREWEHAGGIFILHESAVSTLEKLSLEFKNGG